MSNIEEYKGYRIVPDNKYGYKEIKPFNKTGKVPKPLEGHFTTHSEARKCIDTFEGRLDNSKVDKDDKAK